MKTLQLIAILFFIVPLKGEAHDISVSAKSKIGLSLKKEDRNDN